MKKIIFIIFAIFLILIITNEKDDAFRIRVIANSNSTSDTKVKEGVVNIIKEIVNPMDTKKNIQDKLPTLEKRIKEYLKSKNTTCEIKIKNEYFPTKSLNGKIVPSGYYDALVVKIGFGDGNNWWTLLYPEYFNITYDDIKSENLEPRSFFYDFFKKSK